MLLYVSMSEILALPKYAFFTFLLSKCNVPLRTHSSGTVQGGHFYLWECFSKPGLWSFKNTWNLGPTPRESVLSKGPQVITL